MYSESSRSLSYFRKGLFAVVIIGIAASIPAAAASLVTNGDFSANGGVGELNYPTYAGTTYATGWTVGGQIAPTNTTGAFAFVVNSQADSIGFPSGNSTSSLNNLAIWGPGTLPFVNSGGPIPTHPVANTWTGVPVSAFGNGTNFALGVDGAYGTAPVSQTINGLTSGNSYTLSFQYAYAQLAGFGGDTTQDWQVTIGGNTTTTPSALLTSPYSGNSATSLPEVGGDQGFYGWNTFTYNFTASSSSEVLSFLAQGSPAVPPFLLLTNVSIDPNTPLSTSPEPMTGGLLLLAGSIAVPVIYCLRRKRA
jgi:hypothetical protein